MKRRSSRSFFAVGALCALLSACGSSSSSGDKSTGDRLNTDGSQSAATTSCNVENAACMEIPGATASQNAQLAEACSQAGGSTQNYGCSSTGVSSTCTFYKSDATMKTHFYGVPHSSAQQFCNSQSGVLTAGF